MRYRAPEGTYLAWLDFRDYDLPQSPGQFVIEHAKVVVIDGPECGTGGAGFLRLNFATPRPVLAEIVQRIAAASYCTAGPPPPPPITSGQRPG